MRTKIKSKIFVFIFSAIVWFALTGAANYQEIILGIVIAILISLVAGQFLITTEKSRHPIRRFFFFILYIFKFVWEMIKANIEVAYLVIHPLVPIKPGIVKIKTKLTKDSSITVLSNSITLTPGTLTVDVNKDKQELYVHWIKVKSTDIDEATKEVAHRFEKLLTEVFE